MRLASVSTALAASLLAFSLSCGGDDDGGDGSDADAGGEDRDGGSGADAGDDPDGGDPDGGNPARLCGGLAGLQCQDTHYCDWPNDSCGAVDDLGECKPRPAECEAGDEVVCGCDGMRYTSPCAAAMAGHDISQDTSCTAR